jgi:hypothetical protein
MRKKHYIIASGIAVFCLAIGLYFFFLFRGNLDTGKFQVLRTTESLENRIAIVAKRSDHNALSGDVVFVFVADHIYSPNELRAAFHRQHMIFAADRDGLDVHWAGSHKLVIKCKDCGITKDRRDEQQFRDGDISVEYVNFP